MESSADGKKVTMYCKVKADPKPTVTWTRESVTIKESSRISMKVVQEKDTYSIKLELTVTLIIFIANDLNNTLLFLGSCSE